MIPRLVRSRPPVPNVLAAALAAAIALQVFLLLRGAISGVGVAHPDAAAPAATAGGGRAGGFDLALIGQLFGVAPAVQDAGGAGTQLVLTGTFLWGEAGTGMAIVGPAGEPSKVFHVGTQLPGGFTLAGVFADHIVVSRAGVEEIVRFAPRSADGGPDALSMTPAVAEQPGNLLGGLARAVPRKRGANVSGYVVYPSGDTTAFAQMGLRSGDLIVAINGTRLDDPKTAQGLVGTLAWASGVAVTVRRGGKEKDLVLNAERAVQSADQARELHELASAAKDPVMRPYRRPGAAAEPDSPAP